MTTTPPVIYDFATWVTSFPEFAACSPSQGQAWFNRANLYCFNSLCNPAASAGVTSSMLTGILPDLLYLLTSHLAWLYAPRDGNCNPSATGQPAPNIVGRISSASEGSVSVSAEWNGSGSPSEAFFITTRYGAEFWQATAQFRTAIYVPPVTVNPNSIYPGFAYPRPYRRW